MSSESRVAKLEEQRKRIDEQIRKERKALKEKNERQIGRNVSKFFGLETWGEIESELSKESADLKIEPNGMTISKHEFEILKELKNHAEEMEWNGNFWKVQSLPKMTEILSQLREDKNRNN